MWYRFSELSVPWCIQQCFLLFALTSWLRFATFGEHYQLVLPTSACRFPSVRSATVRIWHPGFAPTPGGCCWQNSMLNRFTCGVQVSLSQPSCARRSCTRSNLHLRAFRLADCNECGLQTMALNPSTAPRRCGCCAWISAGTRPRTWTCLATSAPRAASVALEGDVVLMPCSFETA